MLVGRVTLETGRMPTIEIRARQPARLVSCSFTERRTTENFMTVGFGGAAARAVVERAHLNSVPVTPGINDAVAAAVFLDGALAVARNPGTRPVGVERARGRHT
ncbi:hypothetical protein ACFV0R_22305 [Streptomyces sp. NPDC059578]|uniref:hypothetical protein n=1 Tax=unclassified Streptomyces TaxID=2593676 RepID=UPI00364F1ED3